MKTNLREIFNAVMALHGETFEEALEVCLTTDPDEEFDNAPGRQEGGEGFVRGARGMYVTSDAGGERVVLAHPINRAEVSTEDELKAATTNFLNAVRDHFGEDAFVHMSDEVLKLAQPEPDKSAKKQRPKDEEKPKEDPE